MKTDTLNAQLETVLRPIEGRIRKPSMYHPVFGRSGRPTWIVHYDAQNENVDDALLFVSELPASYATQIIVNRLALWRLVIHSGQGTPVHPTVINEVSEIIHAASQSKKCRYAVYTDGVYLVFMVEGGEKLWIRSEYVLGAIKKSMAIFDTLMHRLTEAQQ